MGLNSRIKLYCNGTNERNSISRREWHVQENHLPNVVHYAGNIYFSNDCANVNGKFINLRTDQIWVSKPANVLKRKEILYEKTV